MEKLPVDKDKCIKTTFFMTELTCAQHPILDYKENISQRRVNQREFTNNGPKYFFIT